MARVVADARRWRGTWPQAGGEFWRNRSPVRGLADGSWRRLACPRRRRRASRWASRWSWLRRSWITPRNWAPGLSFRATRSIRDGCWRSTILLSCFTSKAMRKSLINLELQLSERGIRRLMARAWPNALPAILAARGLVVFSGMARGIDTAAHRGALNAHGQTVAIWGTGIDEVYPKENQKITDQILASGGAILTEFPLGTFPSAAEFSHSQPDHQRHRDWRAGD